MVAIDTVVGMPLFKMTKFVSVIFCELCFFFVFFFRNLCGQLLVPRPQETAKLAQLDESLGARCSLQSMHSVYCTAQTYVHTG